jgi:hypothetical protein
VEKIQVIHSSAGVYYYYYSFFLSKLTKKGKTGRRDASALCLQKKSTSCHHGKLKRKYCPTAVLSAERTRRPCRLQNSDRALLALKTLYT